MDTIKIGKFLAQLRHEKNLTQEQAAEQLGTSNKTISRWENGNYMPPVEMLMELSEFYSVSINEILSGKRLECSEVESAAEQNLKEVLMVSSFSIKERKEYFAKKWKRDHLFGWILVFIVIVGAMLFGFFKDELLIIIGATVCGFVLNIVSYNRMMAYVERNVFREKTPKEDKKS